MAKYRKKPVVIDAFWWGGNLDEIPESFKDKSNDSWVVYDDVEDKLHVKTLEGTKYIVEGEYWLIMGIEGEIYPCRKDIFEATYEKVGD